MIQKLFLVVLLLTQTIVFSQKKTNPTPEDIQLSKELQGKYPDDKIAILENLQQIDFNYDKKHNKVTVKNIYADKFINLNSRTTIQLYAFYDDQSYPQDLIITYRNNTPTYLNFKDEYYNNEGLFHADARVKWSPLNFPLKGYRYNFKYNKKYKDVKYFTSVYFDDMYPVVKKTITINIPEWLDLEIREMNFDGFSIKKDKSTLKEGGIKYTYTIENVNAIAKDENGPGPSYYRPHLLFLAKSHTKTGITEKLLSNTNDLYSWYHSLIEEMNDDATLIEEKTLSLIKDCNTDEEKLKKIYYWVQDNIRYIAFEDGIAGFKPDESQNVYKKKYGDCKGMANLTKQMLKIAGFDARLTWIGTKRIAYDYSLPTIAVDNHMICTVFHDGKKYFLDATEEYNPLGAYAERIQNQQVLIEDGENYILDKIPNDESEKNMEVFSAKLSIEDEELIGSISRNYKGQSKSSFLYGINNLKTDKREEILEHYINKGDKNITISDVVISDINDRDGDLNLNYQIHQKNAVSAFDNELYIDIDYYKEYKGLDMDKRKLSYLLPYKIFEKTSIDLEIPKGYRVKELPKDLNVSNKDFEISFHYKEEGEKIVYKKTIHFKNAEVSKGELMSWKTFHTDLKNQYQKQIILTKI